MTQTKVNMELEGLGDDLTSTDANDGYIMCRKLKITLTVQDIEENNVLLP